MARITAIAEEFLKSGEFKPEMINVGTTLRAEESDRFYDLVRDNSDFMKLISIEKCNRLKKDVNVWEFIQEVLQRIPEGKEPDEYTSFKNVGKQLDLAEATLFSFIPLSFLEDNARKPNIESMIEAQLSTIYGRDVVRLGFLGVKEDNSSGFATLNKGWVQQAKDAANTPKINATSYEDTDGDVDWEALLSDMIEALPKIYKSESAAFVMNKADHEKYARQIGNRVAAHPILFSGETLTPFGYKIVIQNDMPSKHVLFGPLKNLVFGHGTEVKRFRELSGVKRCINYTVTSYFDYQIAVDEAAVVAWKQ